jgi:hypothetical protein
VIERPIGHEYVVGHSDTFAAAFKFNHDIKLLGAGEGEPKYQYVAPQMFTDTSLYRRP